MSHFNGISSVLNRASRGSQLCDQAGDQPSRIKNPSIAVRLSLYPRNAACGRAAAKTNDRLVRRKRVTGREGIAVDTTAGVTNKGRKPNSSWPFPR